MAPDKPFANLFYFRLICHIGGTEQFLYEIAKKYRDKDITILYDECDIDQLIRLRKLVRCVKREQGARYYAKKAFYNFNVEAIGQVEADEHIFVSHAIYQQLGYAPPITNPKFTGFMSVSEYGCRRLKDIGASQGLDIEPVRCYNPLTLEKADRVVRIISAGRLEDSCKGGERTRRLIEALDKYCEKSGRHYLWHIYTNKLAKPIKSPNVVVLEGRADIRPYIADADWLVQVSDDMETYCYSLNEALGYGTRIVRTPLTVASELNIPASAEEVLDWDCGNIDEVAKNIFKTHKPFKYVPPKDGWDEVLVDEPSDYNESELMVQVRALVPYYDLELQSNVKPFSSAWETNVERAEMLADRGYVEIVA